MFKFIELEDVIRDLFREEWRIKDGKVVKK